MGGHAAHDLAVGGDGVGDGRLLAATDGGHDERRMGHGIGGEQGHGVSFLFRAGWRTRAGEQRANAEARTLKRRVPLPSRDDERFHP